MDLESISALVGAVAVGAAMAVEIDAYRIRRKVLSVEDRLEELAEQLAQREINEIGFEVYAGEPMDEDYESEEEPGWADPVIFGEGQTLFGGYHTSENADCE